MEPEVLLKWVFRNIQLIVVLFVFLGPVVASIVRGIREAKRRQKEVEERRAWREQHPEASLETLDEPVVRPEPAEPESIEVFEDEPPAAPPAPVPARTEAPARGYEAYQPAAFEPQPIEAGAREPQFAAEESFLARIQSGLGSALGAMPTFGAGVDVDADASARAREAGDPDHLDLPMHLPRGNEDWRNAIILSEILRPPVSMQR